MSKYEETSEETVSELLEKSKDLVRKQMENGWNQWEYLVENTSFTEDDLYGMDYRDLLYYSVSMKDSNLKTHPHPFSFNEDDEIVEVLEDGSKDEIQNLLAEIGFGEIETAQTEVGTNIWEKLGEKPCLRIAKIEDNSHVYLEFWLRTGSKSEFHERRGEFIDFPTIRRISCRVHLDDNLVEVRGRNDRDADRKAVLNYLERLFGDSIAISRDSIEIDDDTIRYFLNEDGFISRPHSKKDGVADSRWSTPDRDVTDDGRFPEDRPNKKANLRFNIPEVGKAGFQLSAEDNTFRVFSQKITPHDHTNTVEFIKEKIDESNS